VSTAPAQRRPGRQALADAFLETLPPLRRAIEERIPEDVREELATVTFHQLEALLCLSGKGGLTMNDLARVQGVSLSSCTALADRLVRHGLVERQTAPADRRVVRLVPTARALSVVERFRAAKRSGALAALSSLDEVEVATLVALMRKMAAAQSSQSPACP
jgi:DNA-binding MarR family transcriptional regulator